MRNAWGVAALLFCGAAWAAAPARIDFATAGNAYRDRRFDVAFAEFEELARAGHARSQYHVAIMYFKGEGKPASPARSYAWMSVAAANRLPAAIEQMKKWEGLGGEDEMKAAAEIASHYGPEAVAARLLPVSPCAKPPPADFTPPAPLKMVIPRYPFKASDDGLAGWVVVHIFVKPDGRASDMRIVEAFPRGEFENAALRSVLESQFKPATAGGKPTGFWGRFTFRFHPAPAAEMRQLLKTHLAKLDKQIAAEGNLSTTYVAGLLRAYSGEAAIKDVERGRELILSAAMRGLPEAQLVYTTWARCGESEGNQYWMHQAAAGGNENAQLEIAHRLMLEDMHRAPDAPQRKEAVHFWLDRATALGSRSALLLEADYLTDARLQDPSPAVAARLIAIGKDLAKRYPYDPSGHGALAAGHGMLGDFHAAASAQGAALKAAQKLSWDTSSLQAALDAYVAGKMP